MKLIRIAALSAVAMLLMTGASAQGMKPAAKAPTVCPVCNMPLSAKKDKMHPTKVYLGKNKVAYCCSGCKMPDSLTKKPMAKKHMAKKPMAKPSK